MSVVRIHPPQPLMITITPNILSSSEAQALIKGASEAPPLVYYDNIERNPTIRIKQCGDSEVIRRITSDLGLELVNAHVLYYPCGGGMSTHCDIGVMEGGKLIQKANFEFTAIVYLDSCEGGETYFPDQGVIVRPTPYLMVLHPSDMEYPHGVAVVQSECRHTLILRLNRPACSVRS